MNTKLTGEFSERLITLCDGRPGLRGGIHVEIREPHSTPDTRPSPVLDFTASDETLDRYDEIIVASGWQLGNYRRNPVFQNAHQYGDIVFTLGKALVTEVREGRLYQRIEFATEVNPMARIAYGLYRGGFLNAVSVGFIPVRWENGSEEKGFRRRYLEQELLEVSAVGIPANPNALALGLKAGAVEKTDLKELVEILNGVCDSEARSPSPQPSPQGRGRLSCSTVGNRQLVTLARELRDLLKRI